MRDASEWEMHTKKDFDSFKSIDKTKSPRPHARFEEKNKEQQQKRRATAAAAKAATQKVHQENMLPPNLIQSQFPPQTFHSMLLSAPFNPSFIVSPFYASDGMFWLSSIPSILFVPYQPPLLQPKTLFLSNSPAKLPKPVKEKENPLPDIPLSGMNKRKRIKIGTVLMKNANMNHHGKIKNEAEATFLRNQQFVVTPK